jgi:hypothetical protein
MVYLFQVALPKNQQRVSSFVEELQSVKVTALSQVEGTNSVRYSFRVAESQFVKIMKKLTDLGIGEEFGALSRSPFSLHR